MFFFSIFFLMTNMFKHGFRAKSAHLCPDALWQDLMTQYIEFVADRLLCALGHSKIWNSANPFDWHLSHGQWLFPLLKSEIFPKKPPWEDDRIVQMERVVVHDNSEIHLS